MKINRVTLHKKQIEIGQSLVELSIGITLLLILLMGIFDVGRAIYTKFALQDAAEEGLIYGIGNPDECGQIFTRVQENLDNQILPITPTISVTIGDGGAACGSIELAYGLRMGVVVSSPYVMTMPFFAGNTFTLTGTANGTILRPPPEG